MKVAYEDGERIGTVVGENTHALSGQKLPNGAVVIEPDDTSGMTYDHDWIQRSRTAIEVRDE